MSNQLVLSVVIPVYNSVNYLEECIDSILNQGFREGELEVICVDDGSTDGSGELLDSIAAVHKEVRVIHKSNGGEGSARNAGMEAIRGRYFEFVDSDDKLIPFTIYDIVKAMKKESCDVAQFEFTTDETKVVKSSKYSISPMTITGSVWKYIFDSRKYRNIRFDEQLRFADDTYFAALVLLHNPKCLHTARTCYYYNTNNAGSVMATRDFGVAAQCMLHLAENYKKLLKDDAFPDFKKKTEKWCSRATAAHILYRLRGGDNSYPFDKLKEEKLWPYRKEWNLLVPHIKKKGGVRQSIANVSMFFVGFRPVWWIMRSSGIVRNK